MRTSPAVLTLSARKVGSSRTKCMAASTAAVVGSMGLSMAGSRSLPARVRGSLWRAPDRWRCGITTSRAGRRRLPRGALRNCYFSGGSQVPPPGGLTELLPLGTTSGVFRGNFSPRSSNSARGRETPTFSGREGTRQTGDHGGGVKGCAIREVLGPKFSASHLCSGRDKHGVP